MCNVPEGTVTAEAAGSSPSRKSLTINSFHEKAGECQDFSFIFSLFFSFCFIYFFFFQIVPFSQAASVATLPSALFVERLSPGASWVFLIQ
jgi:hypothetical protein